MYDFGLTFENGACLSSQLRNWLDTYRFKAGRAQYPDYVRTRTAAHHHRSPLPRNRTTRKEAENVFDCLPAFRFCMVRPVYHLLSLELSEPWVTLR